MSKSLSKFRIERNFLICIKSIYGKRIANITLNGEKAVSSGKIRNKAEMSEILTSIQHWRYYPGAIRKNKK